MQAPTLEKVFIPPKLFHILSHYNHKLYCILCDRPTQRWYKIFCKWKYEKCGMQLYSAPQSWYFVEPPFAAITAASPLRYVSNSFAHVETAIFAYSSLQTISCSVRLDGECPWTAIFTSRHRFSIGFRSGLWMGHSNTWICFDLNHSIVALAVCLGSLSCWKVNLCLSLKSCSL